MSGAWEIDRPAVAPVDIPLIDMLAFAAGPGATNPFLIRKRFGVSALRFRQVLNRAIDTDEAAELAPELVARLRMERQQRRDKRASVARLPVRCLCGHDLGRPWSVGCPVRCPNCGADVYTAGRPESLADFPQGRTP